MFLLWKMHKNIIIKLCRKYIFAKTCFTLQNQRQKSKQVVLEIRSSYCKIWAFNKIWLGAVPNFSTSWKLILIFSIATARSTSVTIFQNGFTFLNYFHDFVFYYYNFNSHSDKLKHYKRYGHIYHRLANV